MTTHQLHPKRKAGHVPDISTPTGSVAREHVECHSLGHQWRHTGLVGVDDPDSRAPFGGSYGMIGYRSICGNCKAVRTKWLTRSGEVVNRYEYQEGYSRRGEDKLTPHQWRTTLAVTLFADFEQSVTQAKVATKRAARGGNKRVAS